MFNNEIINKIILINNKKYIFCLIRKKFVNFSSEEWVRQNIIYYLLKIKNLNKENIKVEYYIKYIKKRLDIIIFKKKKPFVIIECKKIDIIFNKKFFNQIISYNFFLKSKYLIITNGIKFFIYKVDYENKKIILKK